MPTNREIAAATFAAFQRGDLEGAFAHTAPDSVFENRTETPGVEGTWHGREGFLEMLGKITDAFSEYRFELVDVQEPEPDRVVLTLHEFVRGRLSGIAMERDIVTAYTFSDGKITKVESFLPG